MLLEITNIIILISRNLKLVDYINSLDFTNFISNVLNLTNDLLEEPKIPLIYVQNLLEFWAKF